MLTMRNVRLWTLGLSVLTLAGAAANVARAGGRILTNQDVLSIKVVNQPDMDTATRVEPDGTVSFPYVGRIGPPV
jgi:protein involved in polysaccharide export with SLBB domain